MPSRKLKEFLDANTVRYVSIRHSIAYTAQEIASLTHIRGKEIAKTVILKADGQTLMAVIPGSHRVDLVLFAAVAGVAKAQIASEYDFKAMFPDCETGAMPPFGNLYGLPVYVAKPLTEDADIAFNAGTHSELIRMAYSDFERLVRPKRGVFSFPP